MTTTFQILDSVAFVTGTNKKNGIGRAIVDGLIEHGAKEVYATARKVEQLDEVVAAHPGKVVAVALDVTDLEAIAQLPAMYPDVDLVVNNAGYLSTNSSLGDVSLAQQEITVNYIAPMAIVKAFADAFNKKTSSAVVNMNSIGSFINFPGVSTYSASKAASHSLTQAQRRELPNTLVVGVYPGPIDTDMAKDLPHDKTSPADVAATVVAALKTGTEDVFPDVMAQQLHAGRQADAKAVELQMAAAPVEVP